MDMMNMIEERKKRSLGKKSVRNTPQVFSQQAIRRKAQQLQPTIRIGKNGLTDALADEMRCQLKKRKLVKVKMLKSFADGIDKTAFAKEIAMKTGAKVVHNVGFVLTLYKP